MDHLLSRVGFYPTLTPRTFEFTLQGNSERVSRQFRGSLPCTKRSIERPSHILYRPSITVMFSSSLCFSSHRFTAIDPMSPRDRHAGTCLVRSCHALFSGCPFILAIAIGGSPGSLVRTSSRQSMVYRRGVNTEAARYDHPP